MPQLGNLHHTERGQRQIATQREETNKKGVTQSSDVTKATKDAYAKQRESRKGVSVLGAPAPPTFSGKGVKERRMNSTTGKPETFNQFQKSFPKDFGDQWTLAGELANAADATAAAAAPAAPAAPSAEAVAADAAAEAQAAKEEEASAAAAAAARFYEELEELRKRLKGLQDTLDGGSKNRRLPEKIKNLKTEIRLIIRLNGELLDIAGADKSGSQPATAGSTTNLLEEAQGILERDAAKVAICHKPTEAAFATGGGKLSPEQIIQLTDELDVLHVKLVNGGSLTPGEKEKMEFLDAALEAPTPWRD